MILNYYLFAAIREYEKKKRRAFDADGSDYFSTIVREYQSALTGWPSDIKDLISPKNWQVERLLEQDRSLRKPRVSLSVDITQKDNLVLDWYPADRFDPRAENDFKYWNDQWLPNSPPFNRLVMIREFGRLSSYIRLGETGKAEQLLIEGILELLDHVADFASYFCEVSKDTWLFLEYDSRNSTMTKPRVLRSCSIRNVAEEKAREETARKAAWLKEKFAENLGLEAITFLQAFEEANGSFQGTARVLKERYSARTEISGSKVKTLVNRLYEEYPHIYDKHCSIVPPGLAPRQKAQLLPFKRT